MRLVKATRLALAFCLLVSVEGWCAEKGKEISLPVAPISVSKVIPYKFGGWGFLITDANKKKYGVSLYQEFLPYVILAPNHSWKNEVKLSLDDERAQQVLATMQDYVDRNGKEAAQVLMALETKPHAKSAMKEGQ